MGSSSLRSKRFCGVRGLEQRITAWKMERVKEGGGGGELHFPRRHNTENPVPRSFFASNPTETLAAQAMGSR